VRANSSSRAEIDVSVSVLLVTRKTQDWNRLERDVSSDDRSTPTMNKITEETLCNTSRRADVKETNRDGMVGTRFLSSTYLNCEI